jgi:hypothetical protein
MADLFLHGKKVETVFDLLGTKENDITYSIGWALARSPRFLMGIMEAVFPPAKRGPVGRVLLQEFGMSGFTDIEIRGSNSHCIIEAKRGWSLPRVEQLRKYAKRLPRDGRNAALAVMSGCSNDYAATNLPKAVGGFPVRFINWESVIAKAISARRNARGTQGTVLRDLVAYLERHRTMTDPRSNLVYVLALRGEVKREWGASSQEHVEKYRVYSHPMGVRGWPSEPPNYLGFRYNGVLKSIHHVDEYEVVGNLKKSRLYMHLPRVPNRDGELRIVYRLGPPIRPAATVRSGPIHDMRVWAMIDLLLTSRNILAARNKSKRRVQAAGIEW